jgi:Tol biopolymer transport system component
MISADGSRIFFQAPFGFSGGQIYLREDGVRTYRLNVSENGPSQFQPARIWDASRDGSRVFFSTSEQLLSDDEDSSEDLYMYDVNKPAGQHLTLISASSSIADPNPNFNSAVAVSDDGQYAYFLSSSQLVSGQPSVFGLALYVWHAGDLNYIGTFQPSEMSDDNGTRATWTFFSSAKTSRVSPDGRYILFMATDAPENRGGYDQDGHREFYLYDADNGRLACVSCNPSGAAAVADAFVNERVGGGVSYSTADLPHSLSDDGRYVFFNTPEALLPEDTNGQPDEYDSKTGQISLLSSGTSSSPSLLIDASSDGRNAFFATRQRLSGWDIDDAYDVYDARVGGGLREPLPVTAACEGESCLPGSPPAPPPPPAASQAAGAGNPPRRCPKGTHRARRHGKVRCVKKHRKHKHNKNHKQSHNNRRAGR